MLGILVIGAGTGATHGVGSIHIQAWPRVPGARVVAVADVNPAAAQAGAAAAGAKAFTDYREALKLPDVHAVDICTPSHLHRPMAEDAAAAGKHVLIEKPIATTLEDATAIIAACKAAGVSLMIAQTTRYAPATKLVRRALDEGRLGDLVYYHNDAVSGFWVTGDRNMWQLKQKASGGHMVHNGIHHADTLLWLFRRRPAAVYAQGRKVTDSEIEIWDRWRMEVLFEDGSMGVMGLGRSNLPRHLGGYSFIQAIGTQGSLAFSPTDQQLALTAEEGIRFYGGPGADFAEPLRDFVEGIHAGESRIPGEQGRAALAIALAAEESARSGQPVQLDRRWF